MRNVQFYHCNKYGHYERDCRLKNLTHYGEEDYYYEEDTLFSMIEEPLANQALLSTQIYSTEWILDSRCTNHMIGKKDIFSAPNSSYQSNIKMGDEKSLKVVAKGEMEVPTKKGNMKVKDIYYASHLKHSFLSIGQMLEKDYKLIFEDKMFYKRRKLLTTIKILKNKLFPL